MNNDYDIEFARKVLAGHLVFFLTQIGSMIINSVFLILWIAIQWGVNRFIEWLQPAGLDLVLLWIFQGIFAVTTLMPILAYYYRDIRAIFKAAQDIDKVGKHN